ncbi:MAG: gamma-glutamyl-gamma-aminobutyrate hydrolase family protein [Phycisphaeraceae bacterium]|nr:gamma-glutamyl-gamma-aminobutyrate hydrolase family protein [Phycisphaeraceae bacterium]
MNKTRPSIGITSDVSEQDGRLKLDVALAYCVAVERAGGVPLVLPPQIGMVDEFLARCDGFLLTGGSDPRTEPFGEATHPKSNPMHPLRQEFETKLLAGLNAGGDAPVLGVCLGMQMMCLVAGGKLDQRLADHLASHADHWAADHPVAPIERGNRFEFAGVVQSRHRQAVTHAGKLTPIARSADGVLEAVFDASRKFYVGVQWHPERTRDEAVGQRLFDELVRASKQV